MPNETSRIKPPSRRPPPFRKLRVYAFDPSLDWQIDTAVINQMTLQVPWEELRPGPVGEYLEVVDVDPAEPAAATRRSISTTASSSRRTASTRPRGTPSSTSRWSTPWR